MITLAGLSFFRLSRDGPVNMKNAGDKGNQAVANAIADEKAMGYSRCRGAKDYCLEVPQSD